MSLNKKDKEEEFEKNKIKFDLDRQDFWLLVKSAYKAILPFVLVIVAIYFLFTLFLTGVVMK